MPVFVNHQSLIGIDTFFVENIKPHGNSVFSIINSAQEMQEWKDKGYKTIDEINQLKSQSTNKILPTNDVKTPGTAIPQVEFDEKKVIQKITTHWSRLTWKTQNEITNNCLIPYTNAEGNTLYRVDILKFKELKLKACLKKWNLTNENGSPVEVSAENIDMLDPVIGEELSRAYDKITLNSTE